MRNNSDPLTRDEKVLWLMYLLECGVTNEYYAVLERLHPLSYEELEALDKIASEGISKAEGLREVLLSDADMKDILFACPFAYKHHRNQNIKSILRIINTLHSLGRGLENLEVHINADIRHVIVSHSGMDINRNYTDNPEMVRLIDEYPDRMVEITNFRVKRKTDDAALMREALNISKPLADGTL